MDGPLEIVQVGNEPIPRHDYTLTLQIPFYTYCNGSLPDIDTALNSVLSNWRDGRYPFQVEMLVEGAQKCLENALFMTIEAKCREKYGNEMVVISPRYSRSKARMEAERIYAEYKESGCFPYLNGEFTGRVECVIS